MIQNRKNDHIELCLQQDVETLQKREGLDEIYFLPSAYVNSDFDEVDPSISFLGFKAGLPFFMTGMTGGVERGEWINESLASVAEKYRIVMGVGSQRMALENPALHGIFQLKKKFPQLYLLGNYGFAQLSQTNGVDQALKAIEQIDANALALHLNLVQELIQSEGDRKFKGFYQALEKLRKRTKTPLIIKEVGSGIDLKTAQRLIECGVDMIDVGGRGGTSWGYIEGLRDNRQQQLGGAFRNWGIPTAYALQLCREKFPDFPFTATGGVRSGLDVLKLVGLGATAAGVGLPFLKSAVNGPEAVEQMVLNWQEEIRVGMFACGTLNCLDLGKKVKTSQRFAADVDIYRTE